MARTLIIWLTFFTIGCLSQNQTCPPYEVYNTCGTACEPSCDNPYPGVCTKQCVVGCQCEKGYFRNKASNGCVPLNQCPATRRTTTRYPSTSRRTWRTHPTTRRTTSIPVPTLCHNVNCAANRTTCAIVRSISCAQPTPRYTPFPPLGASTPYYPRSDPLCLQKAMCIKKNACIGMFCPMNTSCVLQEVTCIAPPCDPIAMCVPSSNNSRCGRNEVYKECSLPPYCERSCDTMSTTVACPLNCGPPSCQCMSGYYRDREGRCVSQLVCYLQILIDVLMGNYSSQQRPSVGYMQDEDASQELQNWSREDMDENRPYPGPQSDPWIHK